MGKGDGDGRAEMEDELSRDDQQQAVLFPLPHPLPHPRQSRSFDLIGLLVLPSAVIAQRGAPAPAPAAAILDSARYAATRGTHAVFGGDSSDRFAEGARWSSAIKRSRACFTSVR
jgi:hypothetical protein